MLANVTDGMVVMDRQAYGKFKSELYRAFRERPDIQEKFSSRYETILVMNSNANYMDEENYGAVLRILLERNRIITPAYKDMSTVFRRIGWQNGKKELLKPPISDETKKSNPSVVYDSAFDKSIEHFAKGMFRAAGKLEIIIEKPEIKSAEERSFLEDTSIDEPHNVSDYLVMGAKYLLGAVKGAASAGVYVASAVNKYKNKKAMKDMHPDELKELRRKKIEDECNTFVSKISTLKNISERGRIVSIYNGVTGEAVMIEELRRHHEMRFISLVPEQLYDTIQFHIANSSALEHQLNERISGLIKKSKKDKKI